MTKIAFKKKKIIPFVVLVILLCLLSCLFYPFTTFVFFTSTMFLFIALKSLHKALFLMLATHPLTRDGFVITIGIVDVHFIYIFQFIIVIVWFLQKNSESRIQHYKEISILFKVMVFALIVAALSTLLGGISSAGIREIFKYGFDILTTYVVYKIVANDLYYGISIIKGWIRIIVFFAIISILMSLIFAAPFPSYRVYFEGSTEIVEYREPQPFKYISYDQIGEESYNRLELGFGSPYGSYPCILMAALLIALSPIIEKINLKEFPKKKYLLFSVILFLVLSLTYTRSAWVGLIIGLFMLFLLSRFKLQIIKIAIPVFLLLIIYQPSSIMQRLLQINLDSTEGSVVSHLETFQIAEDAIYSHPIMGVGFANLIGTGIMADISRGRGVVHSAFLQQWAELGTTGLLLFLFIPFYLFYLTKKNEKNIKVTCIIINKGIISALLAIIVQSMFIPGLDVIFWVLLGFAIAFNTQLLKPPITQKSVQSTI